MAENGWKWLKPADRPPPPPSKTLKDSPHQRDRKKPRKKQRKREKTQQRESFHNNSLRYHPSPTFTFETQLQRVVFKPWLIHWQSHFVDWILAREIHHFTSFHLILRLQSNCKRVTTTKTIVSSFFGCYPSVLSPHSVVKSGKTFTSPLSWKYANGLMNHGLNGARMQRCRMVPPPSLPPSLSASSTRPAQNELTNILIGFHILIWISF